MHVVIMGCGRVGVALTLQLAKSGPGGGVVFAAGTLTQSGTNRTLMIGTNQG